MAAVAAFSGFSFHRIFGGLVGEALKEHIRRLRLERAARSLKRLEQGSRPNPSDGKDAVDGSAF